MITYTGSDDWETFGLDGVFETSSSVLAVNACPVTNIRVCFNYGCSRPSIDKITGLRVRQENDTFLFEVNLAKSHDPVETFYFEVSSYSQVEYIPFDIYVYNCSG